MTKYCINCNKENDDVNKYCLHCGFYFTQNSANSVQMRKNSQYSNRSYSNRSYTHPRKNPTFALLLSLLVPGAGHIYLEKRGRGFVILLINFIFLPVFILISFFSIFRQNNLNPLDNVPNFTNTVIQTSFYTNNTSNYFNNFITLSILYFIVYLIILVFAAVDTRNIYNEYSMLNRTLEA